MIGDVQRDFRFVFVEHPIEPAPDLAAVNFLGSTRFWQRANGLDRSKRHRDMCVVLIGQVLGVDDFRPSDIKDRGETISQRCILRILDDFARKAELPHRRVVPKMRGFVLFFSADRLHIVVQKVRVFSFARAPTTVRAGDAAEPILVAMVTCKDSVERHELEIILVRADPEMRDPLDRGVFRRVVWNVKIAHRIWLCQDFGSAGKLAAAIAWPWRFSFSPG